MLAGAENCGCFSYLADILYYYLEGKRGGSGREGKGSSVSFLLTLTTLHSHCCQSLYNEAEQFLPQVP